MEQGYCLSVHKNPQQHTAAQKIYNGQRAAPVARQTGVSIVPCGRSVVALLFVVVFIFLHLREVGREAVSASTSREWCWPAVDVPSLHRLDLPLSSSVCIVQREKRTPKLANQISTGSAENIHPPTFH